MNEWSALNLHLFFVLVSNKGYTERLTYWVLPKVLILKCFTVNQTETLIEVQCLIETLNRNFWVGAVLHSYFESSIFCPK